MKSLLKYINQWASYVLCFAKTLFMNSTCKNLEIIALRSQLALLTEQLENKKIKKTRPTSAFRQLWVIISKVHRNWKSDLVVVKPATVIRWHKKAFKLHAQTAPLRARVRRAGDAPVDPGGTATAEVRGTRPPATRAGPADGDLGQWQLRNSTPYGS